MVYVAAFLPNEAAVALALSSKTMYNLVGRRRFGNLSIRERWNLILLLERDSGTMVACHECLKLHCPFAPRARHRLAVALPRGLTPALLRFVAKQFIRGMPYTDLFGFANRTIVHTLSDFKLFSTITCHASSGNFFLRRETLIAPMASGNELTARSAYLLNEIVDSKTSHACPHVRWQHLGLELSRGPNSGNDYPSSLSASYLRSQLDRLDFLRHNGHRRSLGNELQNMDLERLTEFQEDERYAAADRGIPCRVAPNLGLRFHLSPRCYDSTPIPHAVLEDALGLGLKCALLHPQPCADTGCENLPTRLRVNLVRACEICDTDMCIGSQDVESVGRVISLTTWKNLGGIHENGWRSWYTHYSDVEQFASRFLVNSDDGMIIRDLAQGAAVYRAFQGIPTDAPEPPISWYTASITPRALVAFTGTPSVSERQWWKLPNVSP